jgi:hypothetical protein
MNQSLQDNHDEILLKEESNERQAKAKHPNNKHKKEESL